MIPPTSWDDLPLVLDTVALAAVLDLAPKTIWRKCRARTMRPAPIEWARPYRWSRDAVRAWVERQMPTPRAVRRHHQQRASLPPSTTPVPLAATVAALLAASERRPS